MFTRKLTFLMHISIRNLGIIETAEIELNGITVLSGYNDTGKSFIGKMIYSIVNTIKNGRFYYEDGRKRQFTYNLERISIAHRRVIPSNMSKVARFLTMGELEAKIHALLARSGFNAKNELIELLDRYKKEILLDFESFNEKNSRIKQEDLASVIKEIELHFQLSELLIKEEKEEELLYLGYFQSVIVNGIFDGNINPIGSDALLEVRIDEGSTPIVYVSIQDNVVINFHYNSSSNPLFKRDSILIETPTIISLDKYFNPTNQFQLKDRELPLQYDDLLTKIRTWANASPVSDSPDIRKQIGEIINGNLIYDNQERAVIYNKKGRQRIDSNNIATGIKSFGLLQMLLQNGHLDRDVILILDEPEVHLHPKWEIEYARLLFALCKEGITILMSTHSIYFIEALVKYSNDYEMEDKLRFYFGEKNDKLDTTKFRDVTGDLDPIFKALSKAMRDVL